MSDIILLTVGHNNRKDQIFRNIIFKVKICLVGLHVTTQLKYIKNSHIRTENFRGQAVHAILIF